MNNQTEFCIVTLRAYRGIGLNRLNKVSKVHVSLIRNLSEGGSTCIPRNLRFVRGPMRRRRRVWIFDKVCKCSLEASRELYFCRGGRRFVECSEKNRHYEMVKWWSLWNLLLWYTGHKWLTFWAVPRPQIGDWLQVGECCAYMHRQISTLPLRNNETAVRVP